MYSDYRDDGPKMIDANKDRKTGQKTTETRLRSTYKASFSTTSEKGSSSSMSGNSGTRSGAHVGVVGRDAMVDYGCSRAMRFGLDRNEAINDEQTRLLVRRRDAGPRPSKPSVSPANDAGYVTSGLVSLGLGNHQPPSHLSSASMASRSFPSL